MTQGRNVHMVLRTLCTVVTKSSSALRTYVPVLPGERAINKEAVHQRQTEVRKRRH